MDQTALDAKQLATQVMVPVVFTGPQSELVVRCVLAPQGDQPGAVAALTVIQRWNRGDFDRYLHDSNSVFLDKTTLSAFGEVVQHCLRGFNSVRLLQTNVQGLPMSDTQTLSPPATASTAGSSVPPAPPAKSKRPWLLRLLG